MNDTGTVAQLLILIVLLLLSAFFSSAETALTTVNKIRMRTLSEAGNTRADRVLRITDDNGKMLSAILIGNNIVNLSASSLATTLAIQFFGSVGAGIATGILTLLILIFGEVTPKTLASLKADQLSLAYSGVISLLMFVLTPAIFIVNKLSLLVLTILRVDTKGATSHLTEEEIRTIVDVGQEVGVIENTERDMIHNLFDFSDSKAKEIMIPRIDMTVVHESDSYEEVLSTFRQDKFTRLPVYDEESETVIGIINIKDLLLTDSSEDFSVRKLMREPYFTFEHKNTADLFLEMRKSSISLAIVLDEYGSTAGLLTLEDLLEEIVGEIRDEYDTDEIDDITPVGDHEFIVLGSTNIDDFNNRFSSSLTSEDYDTIGGYCLGQFNHFPEHGEEFTTEEGILFRIQKVDNNRIEKILITVQETICEEKQ